MVKATIQNWARRWCRAIVAQYRQRRLSVARWPEAEFPLAREAHRAGYRRKWKQFRASLPIDAVDALRLAEAENPFSDYRPARESAQIDYTEFASLHNSEQKRIDEYRNLRHRLNRLTRIRAAQKLSRELAIIESARRFLPVELHTTPIISDKYHLSRFQIPDTTEPALKILLDTLPQSIRMDVAAECWILRSEHPGASADAVFKRACRVVRQASKGLYSRDAERFQTADIDNEYARLENQAAQWHLSQLREEAAEDFRAAQLPIVLALVRSQLSPEILQGLLAGESQTEIVKRTGLSQPTISRRIQTVADYAPAAAAAAPLTRFFSRTAQFRRRARKAKSAE